MSGTALAGKANKKCAAVAAGGGDSAWGVGGGPVACGNGCFCLVTATGCCFCHQPQGCGGLTPCRKNGDCPRGWQCSHSCCGGLFCPRRATSWRTPSRRTSTG